MVSNILTGSLALAAAMMTSSWAWADEPPMPKDPMWQNAACTNPMLSRGVIKKRLSGHVSALFDITPEGKVENIRITESDPKGVMDGAVQRALRRWEYFYYFEDGIAAPRKDVAATFTFGEGGNPTCTHIPLPEMPSTAGDPADPYVQLKQCTMLVMPQKEANDEIAGKVTLHFDITMDGKVDNISVAGSTPEGLFDEAAKRSLSTWKYHDFKKVGETVARPDMEVSMYFGTLPEGAPDNRCGYAPWDATNTISSLEYENRKNNGLHSRSQ